MAIKTYKAGPKVEPLAFSIMQQIETKCQHHAPVTSHPGKKPKVHTRWLDPSGGMGDGVKRKSLPQLRIKPL
jgi:hypothetical protein